MTERFFTLPQGHMGSQEMLRFIRRHILEAIFQVMREVNCRKGQKQLKQIVLHLKSTPWPPIYDRAYPALLSTASAGNPVGIAKPSSLILFVQPHKNFLKQSRNIKETYLLIIFGNKYVKNFASQSKLALQLTPVHIA